MPNVVRARPIAMTIVVIAAGRVRMSPPAGSRSIERWSMAGPDRGTVVRGGRGWTSDVRNRRRSPAWAGRTQLEVRVRSGGATLGSAGRVSDRRVEDDLDQRALLDHPVDIGAP